MYVLICVPVCVSCVCATVLVVQYDHIIRPFMQQTIQSQITVGICVTLHQKAQIRKIGAVGRVRERGVTQGR